MNCCCKNEEPLEAQINVSSYNQSPKNKLPKFSFRATAAVTPSILHDSNASQVSSSYSSQINQ